ncbi:glycoside hydrolase family 16 protein [Mesoterricola silvestris]|uniref:Glycosyl hydrolase family 16 n=1 Tax=Mesoterricola silvestris TaxID=2927979 RepID=A0AA48K884_9BACT|nr:glycoside hydrolase family 16 protein [Mesoterricola silvestris]BDU71870.1 glycosyl hydrolase family 16 [Mesoterricola silvestris]
MKTLTALPFALATLLLGCGGGSSSNGGTPPKPSGTWVLSWSDEFSGADGSAPDAAKWAFDTGGNGWGNNELETYTSRPANAQIQSGNLVVTAQAETFTGADGITRNYTSARLKTQGLFSQSSGRFEARIKVPTGPGIWPAFWMLGTDVATNGWPNCGEIDVMEVVGSQPSTLWSTLHGPGYSGANGLTASKVLASGKLSDDYHLYAVEWEGTQIRFYLDDVLFSTRAAADLPSGGLWVFDHPFFLILNVAVGGNWPGSPTGSTTWPQKMYVDYVRVYRRS